ncbi:PoNe immunity protein domain-containing protein [Porphyromonas macacae]|uniref:PoNe immunity protein domain-containing protein n=1 Tax=Porphyromonas macacae TaxID=28115 RepID=UPI0024ADAA8C|nr:PoNe immunity protein domain-containing protein [Porphyromonas macacae]
MKLRDELNTEERYLDNIRYYRESIEKWSKEIVQLEQSEAQGVQVYPCVTNIEVINRTQKSIFYNRISLLLSTYSVGKQINEVKKEYLATVEAIVGCDWSPNSDYTNMLWLLSIGVIFNIEDSVFNKLVCLVEQHNPNDYLIDFLINYRFSSWQRVSKNFFWCRPYSFLEQIIILTQSGQKLQAQEKLLEYLKKKWYRGNSDEAWYNDHKVTEKSKDFPHDGYWSFESGALVKILGLDDSLLKSQQYYPYDMVHWQD